MLTQNNLLSNAQTLLNVAFTERDVLLATSNISYAWLVCYDQHNFAGLVSMIFLPKFDVDSVFALLPRATSMMGVPTFYTGLTTNVLLAAPAISAFCVRQCTACRDTCSIFRAHRSADRTLWHDRDQHEYNQPPDSRAGTVGMPLAGVS